MTSSACLAIIGAGPIGLECALAAALRGMDFEIFERAPNCAGGVELYQFVKLFSPWKFNMTELGKEALKTHGIPVPSDPEAFPTGRELIDEYLLPLLKVLKANSHCKGIHFSTEVVSVSRGALLKGESIGGGGVCMPSNKPLVTKQRAQTPFKLLVCCEETERFVDGFDFLIDCSGTYRPENGNWAGQGGMPALGERGLRGKDRIFTTVPDVLGRDRARFAGRRALLVGSGMSAATTVCNMAALATQDDRTSLVWVVRGEGTIFHVIEDDILPQRKALAQLGNQGVGGTLVGVQPRCGSAVIKLDELQNGRLMVTINDPDGIHTEEVDEFVSLCGFRPNMGLTQELQVHTCYASEGPMNLAATLIGASGDCLKQVAGGAKTLQNPEPGLFILGSKSYGRNSAFLLKIGHEQIQTVLDLITVC